MNNFDKQYLELTELVLSKGEERVTRSGAKTLSIHGEMIKHDLSEGFPFTTLRRLPFHLITSELEWTLRGKTDKKSLNELNNHIWDKFCSPKYINKFEPNKEIYNTMLNQNDLGPIYGFQWRHFGSEYSGCETDYSGEGYDQIQNLLNIFEKNTFSKRLLVTNRNPKDIPEMATASCPALFQLIRHGNKLNLSFYQRSVDGMVGLPFDFAFHSLLLHLFCLKTNLQEGSVAAFFNNVEIYEQHIEGAKELIKREPQPLPTIISTNDFKNILDWKANDSKLLDYKANDRMRFDVNISN